MLEFTVASKYFDETSNVVHRRSRGVTLIENSKECTKGHASIVGVQVCNAEKAPLYQA